MFNVNPNDMLSISAISRYGITPAVQRAIAEGQVIIMRNNKPVAALLSFAEYSRLRELEMHVVTLARRVTELEQR